MKTTKPAQVSISSDYVDAAKQVDEILERIFILNKFLKDRKFKTKAELKWLENC